MHGCGRVTIFHGYVGNVPNSSPKDVGNHWCETLELHTSLGWSVNAG